MRTFQRDSKQQGVALITALLFLLLLSALAVGMMYMSTTDTQINANFRSEQQAYFAARAGMEEMRDRMRLSATNTINGSLPQVVPTAGVSTGVLYIINQGSDSTSPAPWSGSYKFYDDELCHDGYSLVQDGTNSSVVDSPCSTGSLPSSGGWYTSITSTLPFHDTAAAVPFKWARLTLKQNNSVLNHSVDGTTTGTSSTVICYTGSYEVLLSGATTCGNMGSGYTNVYLITALAASPKNNVRRMVQAEIAQQPSSSLKYGLFATGTGCGAITFQGAASDDSYDSTVNPNPTTFSETGGSIGTNGNVSAQGSSKVTIGGNLGSPLTPSAVGSCTNGGSNNAPFTVGGNAGFYPGVGDSIVAISTQSPSTPSIPSWTDPGTVSNPSTLTPGTKYGDLQLNAHNTLTLTGGTYYVNSITLTGQAQIVVTGPSVLNVQGAGYSGNQNVINMAGGGVSNSTKSPADFQINYAGSASVQIAGGNNPYMLVNSPNAAVTIAGNSTTYGAVLGNTIQVGGNSTFHYDSSASLLQSVATYYTMLSFRELYY